MADDPFEKFRREERKTRSITAIVVMWKGLIVAAILYFLYSISTFLFSIAAGCLVALVAILWWLRDA